MTLDEQKIKKPSYEELSPLLLRGQLKTDIDEFVSYLRAIKLVPKWYATNAYNIKFKGKIIFRFTLGNDTMSLFFTLAKASELDTIMISLPADMQKFYFNHLRKCIECNPAHNGGRKVAIQGIVYSCCAEPEMRVNNPSKVELEYVKKFIPVRKENISNLAV